MSRCKVQLKFLFIICTIMCLTCKKTDNSILPCLENKYNMPNWCVIDGYTMENSIGIEVYTNYDKHSITNLTFTNTEMQSIPHWIFIDLPQLEYLDLSNCKVLKIEKSTFAHAPLLQQLIGANNFLTEVNDAIFDGADNLVQINLSHNRIKVIGNHVFTNLLNLFKIDLSFNNLDSFNSHLPLNLNEINLNNNRILKFSPDSMTAVNINLNNNILEFIKVDNIVRILTADNNPHLNLGNLHIPNNNRLEILSLSNCSLNSLNLITNLPNLVYLDLSYNPIQNACNQDDKIMNSKNLKTLILKSTQLQSCNLELFTELYNLEVLDISWNNLDMIDLNGLSRLEKLKKLYLNNNNFNNLTLDEVEYLFPYLEVIDISANNWNCADLKIVLKRLRQLGIIIEISSQNLVSSESNIRGIQCSSELESKSNETEFAPKTCTFEYFEFILTIVAFCLYYVILGYIFLYIFGARATIKRINQLISNLRSRISRRGNDILLEVY